MIRHHPGPSAHFIIQFGLYQYTSIIPSSAQPAKRTIVNLGITCPSIPFHHVRLLGRRRSWGISNASSSYSSRASSPAPLRTNCRMILRNCKPSRYGKGKRLKKYSDKVPIKRYSQKTSANNGNETGRIDVLGSRVPTRTSSQISCRGPLHRMTLGLPSPGNWCIINRNRCSLSSGVTQIEVAAQFAVEIHLSVRLNEVNTGIGSRHPLFEGESVDTKHESPSVLLVEQQE